jgi:hypothetical protein
MRHPCYSGIERPKADFAFPSARPEKFPVYIAEHWKLVSIFDEYLMQDMRSWQPYLPRIQREKKGDAILGVDLSDDRSRIVFDIRIPGERFFDSWRRIPFSVELEMNKLRHIIDAATHFHCPSCRIDGRHNLHEKIRLEFREMKIAGKHDEDINSEVEPVGDNLNQNGVINLITGTQAQGMYGIKILNDSAVPLYAALFYFNTNDLSISAYPAGLVKSIDQLRSLSIALSVTIPR